MNPERQWAVDLLASARKLQVEMMQVAAAHMQSLQRNTLSQSDQVDCGGIWRDLKDLMEELRKEAQAKDWVLGRLIALRIAQSFVENPDSDTSVRGELYTGTADIKRKPKIPSSKTPEYAAILRAFGVPDAVIEQGLVKLDYDQVTDYLTRLSQDGKPTPAGLTMFDDPKTIFRKRRTNG